MSEVGDSRSAYRGGVRGLRFSTEGTDAQTFPLRQPGTLANSPSAIRVNNARASLAQAVEQVAVLIASHADNSGEPLSPLPIQVLRGVPAPDDR